MEYSLQIVCVAGKLLAINRKKCGRDRSTEYYLPPVQMRWHFSQMHQLERINMATPPHT
jgi:hypothetical protein